MSLDAERMVVVLGLTDPSGNIPLAKCEPCHFTDTSLGKMWAAQQRGAAAKIRPTLDELCRESGLSIDAIVYLLNETRAAVGLTLPRSIIDYAREVVSDHVRARVSGVVHGYLETQNAVTGQEGLLRLLATLEMVEVPEQDDGQPISKVLHAYWTDVEQYAEDPSGGAMDWVPSGLEQVDSRLTGGGVPVGHYHVVVASSSHGKSALVARWGVNAASRGYPVDIYSLEDSAKALVGRMIAFEGSIPNSQAQRRLFTKQMLPLAYDTISSRLNALPIRIIDQRPKSLEQFCLLIRRNAARSGTKLIVVDYAQLVPAEGRGIYERMVNVAAAMQRVSRDTNAAVVLCSQRSEIGAKGAGELTEYANTVMQLHREDRYDAPRMAGAKPIPVVELHITKQKQGHARNCRIPLSFVGEEVAFADCPPDLLERYEAGVVVEKQQKKSDWRRR